MIPFTVRERISLRSVNRFLVPFPATFFISIPKTTDQNRMEM